MAGNAMRMSIRLVVLVAAVTMAGSCGGGSTDDSEVGGVGEAKAGEVSLDDPCTWATAEDFAQAGFTMPLVKAELDAIDYDDSERPTCELTFEEGNSVYFAQIATGPKDDLPLVFEANGDREVSGAGERMIVQPEVDENGRSTTVTVVLADRSFHTNIGEELADEEAVIAIATTMARNATAVA